MPAAEDVERPPPLGPSAPFAPDVTNITFDGITRLGFPLPRFERPVDYKLYR